MNTRRFKRHVDSLRPSLRKLLSMVPVKVDQLPTDMPSAGIYLFTERGKHLYVGRSNRLRGRLQRHSRESASHNSASFAFRLARKRTGKTKASYQGEGSRKALAYNPGFAREFSQAKKRIGRMQIRFVEETDPIRQALLEIYVSEALETPHNDFDTH